MREFAAVLLLAPDFPQIACCEIPNSCYYRKQQYLKRHGRATIVTGEWFVALFSNSGKWCAITFLSAERSLNPQNSRFTIALEFPIGVECVHV